MALIFAAIIRKIFNNAIALLNAATPHLYSCLSAINPCLLSETWPKGNGQRMICSIMAIDCRVFKQFWVHI